MKTVEPCPQSASGKHAGSHDDPHTCYNCRRTLASRPSVNATDDQTGHREETSENSQKQPNNYETVTANATDDQELVEKVARAMLADELSWSSPKRDFDTEWENESEVWLRNAKAAIEAAGVSSLSNENGVLKSALERLARNFRLMVSRKPVRDVAETLAEVDAALASTSHRGMENG